ncbi:hypothetical protein FGG08_005854 [Glutinoglossum americanum]|uniref:Cytochrome c oxidase assembly protein COX20, mitochondrial n=1 Tax=Glutinoglossum americanum TaxID=1670608 RepID=A0A9P8I271_9PEZI|nr:hypothetical protein FGG08_005854 [Glutinoglossum americanum]
MAADTRDEPGSTDSPKTYASFTPPENANALPGDSPSAIDGRRPNVGIAEIAKSITLEDFRTVHTKPCVRDSLLMGILGGFGVGGVRAILGVHDTARLILDGSKAPIPKASNWAVGTFCISSFVAYEICQYKRMVAKEGIKRAVEVVDRKKIEREQKMKEARERRRQEKMEADAIMEEERQRKEGRWWKVW